MTDLHRRHLYAAVRAVAVHGTTTCSWMGQRSLPLPAALRAVLTPSALRSHLLAVLQGILYRHFYAGEPWPPTVAPASASEAFVEALRRANSGRGHWSGGWRLAALRDGCAEAARGRLTVRADSGDWRTVRGPAVVGSPAELRYPKELLGASPGYYCVLGDAELRTDHPHGLVRLYWHLAAAGAVPLVSVLTRQLNEVGVPFRLKVPNHPSRYVRRDAGVLYLHTDDYDRAVAAMRSAYKRLRPHARAAVPAFTKRLAPGLGLALDPGHGQSFGMHRSAILAEGLIRAAEQGHQRSADRLATVVGCLRDHGVDPDRPYLNPGVADRFDFPDESARADSRRRRQRAEPGEVLDVAARIGHRLVADAVWAGAVCTWVAPERTPHEAAGQDTRALCRALGPDLYDGTAGVALFLAALYRATHERTLRRTALAAIRHATSSPRRAVEPHAVGFYSGCHGIAWAADHCASLLDDESLSGQATAILQTAWARAVVEEDDLLTGRAGALLACLHRYGRHADQAARERAVTLGDQLVARARRTDAGCSWPSLARSRRPGLTGLSHGAAGIGLALLELAAATGVAKYRDIAEEAFGYERRWFDKAAGNWADLRAGGRTRSTVSYWCHGAPGIALSRLRAYELTGEASRLAEAATALATTRRAVAERLDGHVDDFTLCHGLTGLAEVLTEGLPTLTERAPDTTALIREVAGRGTRLMREGRPWPCGQGTSEPPGLMTGLAGIGMFYLRQHGGPAPSLLLPRPVAPAPTTDSSAERTP
ncbi:lanthionine synthetase LanC family protein [Streptomyces sp. NPDC088789]|uniref:lanthionine synthetase LanC family protein n=1 Tax=Streptomyces sp. NPDC088789 TaxID=3365899 RepID=UPI00380AEF04